MMNTRSKAQRRFLAECAAMAVVALLWLASLVWGLGGPRATQAISNFGLIAAAALAWSTAAPNSPRWRMPSEFCASASACGPISTPADR